MDISNKKVVITGANAGIGYEASLALAGQGAEIVMACRSTDKAEAAKAKLLESLPNAKVDVLRVDVSEPDSIRAFAEEFEQKVGMVDVLINNAGIVTPHFNHNSQGYELHLATNYLGSFGVTAVLMPFFRQGSETRIVNIGSLAHRFGKFDFDDPNWEKNKYNHWKAYARSKIAIASFTVELSRRLEKSGSMTIALGAHPGFAATDMGPKSGATTPKTKFGAWYQSKMEAMIVAPPVQAAQPMIYAASVDGVQGGDYYGPTGLFEIKGQTGKAKLKPLAKDPEFGRRLWALSEKLSGFHFLSDK